MSRFGWMALALGLVVGGPAEAAVISFNAVITKATFTSGITGALTPDLPSTFVSGTVGTDQSDTLFATLKITPFEVDLAGCGSFESGCSNYVSPASFEVKDDHSIYSTRVFQQTGTLLTFDIFTPGQGEISGSFDTKSFVGSVSADLYAGTAFRADDGASLLLQMSVVPLPASLPMFGTAVLALGALAYRKRLTDAREVAPSAADR